MLDLVWEHCAWYCAGKWIKHTSGKFLSVR